MAASAAFAFSAIVGCSPIPRVTQADAQQANSTVSALSEGRALYLASCSNCHVLTPPERFTALEWQGHMVTMAPVSGVNDDETASILRYLQAFAKPPRK